MNIHQILLVVYVVAVVATVFLVAGRLGWCAFLAVRARRFGIAALSVAGIVCVAVLLASVLAWWFLLGVSHGQKDLGDTYAVIAGTGIVFFLVSFGLWRVAGAFQSRLRPGATGQSIPAAARPTSGGSSRAVAVLLAAIVFSVAAPVVAAILFLPVLLLAGPGSSMLPRPLAVLVWLAALAAVIAIPGWLARHVYRLRRPPTGPLP